MASNPTWVLFDLGNVLVEYRPLGFAALAERVGAGLEELASFVSDSGLFDALIVGAIEPEQALTRFAERFGRRLSRADAVACFRDDVSCVLPGAEALLGELEGRVRTAVLSNTFFAHWDHFATMPLYDRIELPMASHLLGAAKPEHRSFEAALERMGASPHEVVFVDDKPENVETAAALGMQTVLSLRSVATTRAGLAELLEL
ncbi:MAG: HAD-IA family hydrolase [Myxococcales bacterium]|nr:HAD-IA family hydrolase [Myxococcales bacterium]